MLNVIFSILVIPFLPFFAYGKLDDLAQLGNKKVPQVLGEEKTKAEMNNNNRVHNFFPLDPKASSVLAPNRTADYADIKIWASSSVVMDVESGTILHYFEGRKQTQIASLTKIMTAVLVMENVKDLNEEVEITHQTLNVSGTVVGCPSSVFCNANRLYVGEKITVRDLLKAMLLNSANDAATALAGYAGGTPKNFVGMMNEKAKSLGLKDTSFCTPSGLEIDDRPDDCYSSAYDTARIAAYSLRYETIWDIMKLDEERIYSTDGKYMHQLKNTDILVNEMENCLGGKTGFTPLAGKSLLTVTTDDSGKHKIVTVILNDENRWEDMKKLVSWTFDNYEWK